MKKIVAMAMLVAILMGFAGCGANVTVPDSTQQEVHSVEAANDVEKKENSISQPPVVMPQPIKQAPSCAECGAKCDEGKIYCSTHGCWKGNCNMPRKRSSVYCVSHSCLMCGMQNSYNSPYCSSHKCSRCANPKVEGSQYCVGHKCVLCNREKFGNKQFCTQHD